MIELCSEYLSLRCIWLYLLIMSRTRFQSESTLYSYLNIKELLDRSSREIWSSIAMPWPTRPLPVGHLLHMSVTVIKLMVKFCLSIRIVFQIFCFFFLKLKGELALAYDSFVGGIRIVIVIEILNDYFFFDLAVASNNEPLGWHQPHLVDNIDTQYLVDQHWQQCWCFRSSFFLFPSVCLRVSEPVTVHLFRINLKFLNSRKYLPVELMYVSPVSGLELKWAECISKCLRTLPKIHGRGISVRVWEKAASSAT